MTSKYTPLQSGLASMIERNAERVRNVPCKTLICVDLTIPEFEAITRAINAYEANEKKIEALVGALKDLIEKSGHMSPFGPVASIEDIRTAYDRSFEDGFEDAKAEGEANA